MTINICGIKHTVEFVNDHFDTDCHMGQINFKDAKIFINADMNEQIKAETLCHEFVHGALVHLGRSELSNDEEFVQALGNAIYQSFDIKIIDDSGNL